MSINYTVCSVIE